MIHRITMPGGERGGAPREIVWDSEAGSLSGDHFRLEVEAEQHPQHQVQHSQGLLRHFPQQLIE